MSSSHRYQPIPTTTAPSNAIPLLPVQVSTPTADSSPTTNPLSTTTRPPTANIPLTSPPLTSPPLTSPPSTSPPSTSPPSTSPSPTSPSPTSPPLTSPPPTTYPTSPNNLSRSNPTSARPWISAWLRPSFIFPFLLLTILFHATIIGLCIYSVHHQGIISVSQTSSAFQSFQVGLALTWTTLPALIFQIYGMLLAAVVVAACMRQPYVELARRDANGAAPEKSIFLDYQQWWTPVAAWKAAKYGHCVLSWAMVVSFVTSLLFSPIGSHLFDTNIVIKDLPVTVEQRMHFDENSFDALSNLSPVFDVVSAETLYNASRIPWTTDQESLLPFELVNESVPEGQIVNISITTGSYGMALDCRALDSAEYLLQRDNGSWYVSASDRGCNLGEPTPLPFTSLDGVRTSITETYHTYCNDATSRIFAAIVLDDNGSRETFSNISFVSCIPSYYKSNGTAKLSYSRALQAPILQSYTTSPSGRQNLTDPVFSSTFEDRICLTRLVGSPTEQATRLGDAILQLAMAQSPNSYLSGDVLINATQTLLISSFNAMAQKYLIVPTSSSTQLSGTINQQHTRVVVVLPVAYAILSILSAIFISLTWIHFYTHYNKDGQYEDSTGIAGYAVLLCGSALMAEFAARKPLMGNGKVEKAVKTELTEINRMGWKIEDTGDATKRTLVSTPKARALGWGKV